MSKTQKPDRKLAIPFRARKGKVNPSPKLRTRKQPEVEVSIDPLEPVAGPLALGEIVLPTKDEALVVLAELARMNDAVLQAAKRYADSAAITKGLKADWDTLAQALSKRLRAVTHQATMPLFDVDKEQRARDEALKNQITPAAEPGETFPAADTGVSGADAL